MQKCPSQVAYEARYLWKYEQTTSQIVSYDEIEYNSHCWTVGNVNSKAKQSIFLSPCRREGSYELESQQFVTDKQEKFENQRTCRASNNHVHKIGFCELLVKAC